MWNDIIRWLTRSYDKHNLRTLQEEGPVITLEDTTTVVGSTLTFCCYAGTDKVQTTDPKWKLKVHIDDGSGYVETKYYLNKSYDKTINDSSGVAATLATLYGTGSDWFFYPDNQ